MDEKEIKHRLPRDIDRANMEMSMKDEFPEFELLRDTLKSEKSDKVVKERLKRK